MPRLISNLRSTFIDNWDRNNPDITTEAQSALTDIESSLNVAITEHITSPGTSSFITSGFGSSWKAAYSISNLPSGPLISSADWIDPLIKPVLAAAIGQKVLLLSALTAGSTPATAQTIAGIVGVVMNQVVPGGAALTQTMFPAILGALTSGNVASVPGIVAAAMAGLSTIILANTSTPYASADQAKDLHFQLNNVGLVGALQTPAQAWAIVNSQVLSIPVNPELAGDQGVDFWRSILITIQQSVPGVVS